MSENDIKPVAWTSETQLSAVRHSGDGIMASTSGQWKIALYDQSAIDRLTAERDAAVADAASLRERMLALEAQRDEFGSREWQAEKDKRQAVTERDEAQRKLSVAVANGNALVGAAERYRWLRDKAMMGSRHDPAVLKDGPTDCCEFMFGEELDAAIDAARAERKP